MKFISTLFLIALISLNFSVLVANAHCEIPCGIYHDDLRVTQIREHIDTIEKSIHQIEELSAAEKRNENQIVRWVMNKETHAGMIQEIASQYFLTQKVKPVAAENEAERAGYFQKLEILHRIMVQAMKAKQSLDLEGIKILRGLTDELGKEFAPAVEKGK